MGRSRCPSSFLSPRQRGRSTELSIVFAFLSRTGTGLEKRPRLRFVTPPSKSIFSRSEIHRSRCSLSLSLPNRFSLERTVLYVCSASAPSSSNNRSVSTLTNFRELAIKGNEETGKSKCGVNIDIGSGLAVCARNSCENSPRFDNLLDSSSFRAIAFPTKFRVCFLLSFFAHPNEMNGWRLLSISISFFIPEKV